ncbi:hypothetical protein BACEGG_01750 [Bacteroides eggerthii DSM 20697]|nr:hypothetical protein BACEGG_01750 [Bacteroides eggerthii DSM 20697]
MNDALVVICNINDLLRKGNHNETCAVMATGVLFPMFQMFCTL